MNTTPSTLALLALGVAASQVSVAELPKNSNKGPMIDKYLASVGLPPGNPWCMAGIHWCFVEACKRLGVPVPVVKTGHVLTCWNKTPAAMKIEVAKLIANPALILPGDQLMMKVGTSGAGHTTLILRAEGTKLHTIEGNTNDDGSREGYEWAIRERSISAPGILGIIRY